MEKGKINRRTSQVAYVTFMNAGKRSPYPLGATLVYSKVNESNDEQSESDGQSSSDEDANYLPDISGGKAEELAANLLNLLELKLKCSKSDLTRYCGTTADGPYQAKKFQETITKETGRENLPDDIQFCQTTIWDAAHLLNLVATDVRDNKIGSSGHFWATFIKRANEFNHLLSSGKGYAQLEVSASAEKKRAVVITPFATQRFLSSAVKQWKAIEKGFKALHTAFSTIHSGADEDFPLQYRMFGQDFVVDLLGLIDATTPITKLMLFSQEVDFCHWKLVFWGKRAIEWMEEIAENITEMPRLKKHLAHIENFKFNDIQLLEGWSFISAENVDRPEAGAAVVYNWKERSVGEAVKELGTCAEDLKVACSERLEEKISEVSLLLSECFDYEKILIALEGTLKTEASIANTLPER